MLFMCVTTSEPVNGNETMRKRLEKGRMFPGGVKVLGEWTVLSGAGGFMLVESNDPKALMDAARAWADVAKRRLAELRSGRVRAVPGDVVFGRIRERFAR